MAFSDKAKRWLQENAPNLIDNKYLGMAHDRFASLPAGQQKLFTLGGVGLVGVVILIWIISSYVTLFGYTGRSSNAQQMLTMISKYEKQAASGGGDLALLQGNKELTRRGALKNYVLTQARTSKISTRSVKVDETMKEAPGGEDEENKPTLKIAKVQLERINLNQLLDFMKGIEFGTYSLGVSSLNIENDPKYRGYMNVNIDVIAHIIDFGEDQ